MVARLFHVVALLLVVAVGSLGSVFIVAETFAEPGGLTALGLSLAWLAPMLLLVAAALWTPDFAAVLLPALAAVETAFVLSDAVVRLVPHDTGPVDAVVVFALAVPSGMLGLRRPLAAGGLLAWLAAVLFAGGLITRGQAPMEAVLTGSSGVLVLPLLLTGALFVLAWLFATPHGGSPAGRRPAPTIGQRGTQ